MLYTQKQRPKTCIEGLSNHCNLKIRPQTASSRPKSINASQGKSAAKNNRTNDDVVKSKEYSIGKVCFGACAQRIKLVGKQPRRPYTAPDSHQIPFDLDQKVPMFDESEYLYLHVPDEGTDSEGEHYRSSSRPKMDLKSSCNSGRYLYYLSKMNGKNVRIVKGKDVEAHVYVKNTKQDKQFSVMDSSGIKNNRLGMRNMKTAPSFEQKLKGQTSTGLIMNYPTILNEDENNQFITPIRPKKNPNTKISIPIMDEKIKQNSFEQSHTNNAAMRLTTARRKSLICGPNNSSQSYSMKQKKPVLADFKEESTGDTEEQTLQSSRNFIHRKSGSLKTESSSHISLTSSRRKSILKIDEPHSYSPQPLSRKSIVAVKSNSVSPKLNLVSNSGIEPPEVSQLSVDLHFNASSANASKDSHLDDLFTANDLNKSVIKNILRTVSKANRMVNRRINPAPEPKIYQKKPRSPALFSTQNDQSFTEEISDLSHKSTTSRRNSVDISSVMKTSFVGRRVSVIMERSNYEVPEKVEYEEDSSQEDSMSLLANSLSVSSQDFKKNDRRYSENSFLGPSLTIPGLSHNSSFNSLKPSGSYVLSNSETKKKVVNSELAV